MFISTLRAYIQDAINSFGVIPEERKNTLLKVSHFVTNKLESGKKAELLYICAHNSRRSHFGQIWGQTAANYYGLKNVFTFSGGTETTVFNPNAIKAVHGSGFKIIKETESINPRYHVIYDYTQPPILCFSKKYNDNINPRESFCAIMTCAEADENCPFIPGAALRIACPYDDPKAFDGMPEQDEKYNERCKKIATESLYIFSNVLQQGSLKI